MKFHNQTAQKKQNTAHIKKCNASCKRKGAASNVKKMSILAVCQAIWIICRRRDQNGKTQRGLGQACLAMVGHTGQWLAMPDSARLYWATVGQGSATARCFCGSFFSSTFEPILDRFLIDFRLPGTPKIIEKPIVF